MKTALQAIGCIALLAVVALCLSLVQVAFDFDDMVRMIGPKVDSSLDQVSAAAKNVNAATQTLAEASAAEKDNWTKASKEAAKTGGAVRLFVDRLDRQLNDNTLPNFDTQLNALSARSQLTLKQAGDAAEQFGFAAQSLGEAADSLSDTVSNPNISTSLVQMSLASQQLAQASGHANNILADGEKVADHYEAEVMAPVSLSRRIAEYVLTFGSDARVLFKGGK